MGASETIAAVATARGRAALAIVRMSGPAAIEIAAAIFRGTDLREADSHTAHVGYVTSESGADLDQVVITIFRAPRSVTGEDVVEISCHGGDFASQLILQRLLDAGARMADPGEFTHRAFMNGKMDLAQAEAVADLIHASSSLAHRVSLSHLQGRYSEVLEDLREELLELCAFLELELDFSEEDVEFADRERLERLLDGSERLLDELLGSYRLGAKLRDGVRVVIGGRPNAGKSTLLNAMLGRDRAIVSETPGTTRDEIEDEAEIEGILFRFVDTAGLREASDAIEAEGVRRAERSIEHADVLLYVYDLTIGLAADERAFVEEARARLPVILVGNKRDLLDGRGGAASGMDVPASALIARTAAAGGGALPPNDPAAAPANGAIARKGSAAAPPRSAATLPKSAAALLRPTDASPRPTDASPGSVAASPDSATAPLDEIRVSAKIGFRVEDEIRPLTERLLATVSERLSQTDASHVVINQRHRRHLQEALEAVRRAGEALAGGGRGDTLALDLRAALYEIGAITGEITNEDVLDQIFSRFCIGK